MKPERRYNGRLKTKVPAAEVAGRKLYWFEWRAFAGWRQGDVAAILGVSAIHAGRIENGTKGCTLAHAVVFADALGIPIDNLFSPPPTKG